MAVSFIGGGNRSTRRKPPTCGKSLTNFITQCCIDHTSPWVGFEFTTLVVIGTDYMGSSKSNYHTITTTTASVRRKRKYSRFYKKNKTKWTCTNQSNLCVIGNVLLTLKLSFPYKVYSIWGITKFWSVHENDNWNLYTLTGLELVDLFSRSSFIITLHCTCTSWFCYHFPWKNEYYHLGSVMINVLA
jgi:hypothetical protein